MPLIHYLKIEMEFTLWSCTELNIFGILYFLAYWRLWRGIFVYLVKYGVCYLLPLLKFIFYLFFNQTFCLTSLPCSLEFSSLCSISQNVIIQVYRIIIFPIVLCECGILAIIIREEYRWKLSVIRLLRVMLGWKTEKGTTWYRSLCNEKVNNLYSVQNIISVTKSQ